MGHRCAREWLTIEVLKVATRQLAATKYTADDATLTFDLKRDPARLRNPLMVTIS